MQLGSARWVLHEIIHNLSPTVCTRTVSKPAFVGECSWAELHKFCHPRHCSIYQKHVKKTGLRNIQHSKQMNNIFMIRFHLYNSHSFIMLIIYGRRELGEAPQAINSPSHLAIFPSARLVGSSTSQRMPTTYIIRYWRKNGCISYNILHKMRTFIVTIY